MKYYGSKILEVKAKCSICHKMSDSGKNIWLFSQFLEGYGGTKTVVALAKKILFEEGITYHHAWVESFSATGNQGNKSGLFFKSLPLPVYLNNLLAGLKWKKKVIRHPAALVIGGSPVAGAISLAARIPYIVWIGTTLYDEYKVRNLIIELSHKNYSLVLNKIFLRTNKLVEKYVLQNSRHIIVQSPYMIAPIVRDYGIDVNKIEYLPYPMSVQNEFRNKTYEEMSPKLIAVGRVDDNRKNYPLLIEAFNHLIKKYPGARLRVVGEISPKSKLLKKCIDMGISRSIEFLGKIGYDELIKEYENANIFVLSSLQEGLGIVYLEAMSYGLPVVTTRCGGPEGIVIDGLNGYLVPQNEATGFFEAIQKVWSSEEKYHELSAQAQNYIRETHDPEILKRRLCEVIKVILARG